MDDASIMSLYIVAALVFLTAYLSATEAALSSVSRAKMKSTQDKGENRAKTVLYLLDEGERTPASIQIIKSTLKLIAAVLITEVTALEFGVKYIVVAIIATAVFVFIFADAIPKTIGARTATSLSVSSARFIALLMAMVRPIYTVVTLIGTTLAELTSGDPEITVTEDELYDIIENMKDEGELDAEKGELVHSALMFADVTVESVLTARVDVTAIDVDDPEGEILATIKSVRHSRLPVYKDSIDNIIGILQIRKYIKSHQRGENTAIEELVDKAYFVHQSTNIAELLPVMSHSKINMAVVTDNYGGTLGIVTMEDILEELVGEIWDEDDEVKETFRKLKDGGIEIDAEADMEETLEYLDFTDPDDTEWNHKLVGEWTYEQFDLLPNEGDKFKFHELIFVVSKMQNHRIMKLTAYATELDYVTSGGVE